MTATSMATSRALATDDANRAPSRCSMHPLRTGKLALNPD